MATIFQKTSCRPLSRYQERINTASQALCENNPGLLRNRQKLLALSREKIIEGGFHFVKGMSRSKKGDIPQEPKQKRQKLGKELRESRLAEIVDSIKDYSDKISFKEKRISSCLNVLDYKTCDELKDSVIELKESKGARS